jgi:hypothetical protein
VPRTETKYWAVHFKRHCRNSLPSCIRHEEKSECMHRWTRWTFPTLNMTLFFVFCFNVIYFLTNKTRVSNGLIDFSITLYVLPKFSTAISRLVFMVERRSWIRRCQILCRLNTYCYISLKFHKFEPRSFQHVFFSLMSKYRVSSKRSQVFVVVSP